MAMQPALTVYCIQPRAQIRMYDAENVALLNSHDDELTVNHLVETRKQNAP